MKNLGSFLSRLFSWRREAPVAALNMIVEAPIPPGRSELEEAVLELRAANENLADVLSLMRAYMRGDGPLPKNLPAARARFAPACARHAELKQVLDLKGAV